MLPSQPLSPSFSLHYTHVPPQATGDDIHTQHTHTHTLMSRLRSCFAMWAAVCHVTKGQWAAARPFSGQPDVCSAIQLVPSAAPPPINSSHTTPAPPSSVTGHPWRYWSWSVATRARLWGGRRIGCHLRGVELRAGGGEMGRRCM